MGKSSRFDLFELGVKLAGSRELFTKAFQIFHPVGEIGEFAHRFDVVVHILGVGLGFHRSNLACDLASRRASLLSCSRVIHPGGPFSHRTSSFLLMM